ncbi:hypothetical protein [Streptomyces roseolus]|uniref:hypothetical protein n=1 Tax=Streptomyces roseolus TaxID=67358 RepID=UPI003661C6A7
MTDKDSAARTVLKIQAALAPARGDGQAQGEDRGHRAGGEQVRGGVLALVVVPHLVAQGNGHHREHIEQSHDAQVPDARGGRRATAPWCHHARVGLHGGGPGL